MKIKLTFLSVFIIFSQCCFAQQDSTLIKFVRGLRTVIDNRAKAAGVRTDSRPDLVVIGDSAIRIDSLYKYNINSFSSIGIKFNLPEAIYGYTSEFGVIILYKKKEN